MDLRGHFPNGVPSVRFNCKTRSGAEADGAENPQFVLFKSGPRVADGANDKVHILDRESLKELTAFGDGGRQPGLFYAVDGVATDSKGNLYTAEIVTNRRAQRFVLTSK